MTAQSACLDDDVRNPLDPLRFGPHGALTHAEARRRYGSAPVREALHERRIVEPWPGVLVAAQLVDDRHTRAAAALLRAGPYAVLSGSTAAAMHGCTAADDSVVSVTIPYDRQRRSLPGLSVRQAWIRESDVVELDGFRVFALEVVLCELLCTGPQRMALACLEQALAAFRGAQVEHFRGLVAERIHRRRDRRGTRQAWGLLEMARPEPAPPHLGAPLVSAS